MNQPTMTRRRLLKSGMGIAAAIPLGQMLSACGGDDDTSTSPSTTGQPGGSPTTASTPSTGPLRGGVAKLVMNNFSAGDTLDPALNFYLSGLLANGVFYDTLVKTDNVWGTGPNLATDWDASDDLMTWRFRLRDGVEFHSGKSLTAEDVVASLQRIVDPAVGSVGYAILGPVLAGDGIVAADPTTVEFRLLQPDAFFLHRVASNYARIHEADASFDVSAGTGPFRSARFDPGVGFEAVRFENYWEDGRPYLDGLNFVATPDPATTVQAVLSGDADICDMASFSLAREVEAAPGVSAIVDAFGAPYDFEINGTVAPFDDPDVRRAIKMMIDREQIAEIAFQGHATPSADSYVNPADPFYPSDLAPTPFDPEQAQSLLAAAGASGTTIEIATSSLGGTNDVAVVIREALSAGGFDASVQQMTAGEYDKAIQEGAIHQGYWQRFHPALVLSYYYASDGIFNYGAYSNPTVDQRLQTLTGTADEATQREIVAEVLHTYNEESSTLWPVHSNGFWPHKERLQGAQTNPTEVIDFRQAYFAE